MLGTPHIFVKNRCRALGINLDILSLKIGISTKTLYSKSLSPEKFAVWELSKMFDSLSMTTQERIEYLNAIGVKIQ